MANAYVTISNTGSIGGGLKAQVKQGTWHETKPTPESFTGLDGTSTRSVGAGFGKWRFKGTLLVQKVGATGYVSLDAAGQSVEEWATTTTAAKTLLKVQGINYDTDATTYDMLWISPYDQGSGLTSGLNGKSEWYEVDMELLQI